MSHSSRMPENDAFSIKLERLKDDRVRISFVGERLDDVVESEANQIASALAALSGNWTSTAVSFLEVAPVLSDMGYFFHDQGFENYTVKFIKANALESQEEELEDRTIETFKLPKHCLPHLKKSLNKSAQIGKTAITLGRSALSALISEYEAFLALVLTEISKLQPDAFVNAGTEIPFDRLNDAQSIAELRSEVISQEVDKVLHENSHLQVLHWIEKAFGVNLTSDKKLIAEFVEICQRRHIVMHNGAIVNHRYLRICREAGFPESDLPELGETVQVSRHYLRRATARVYMVGFFTLHILWQKILHSHKQQSFDALVAASHDFLENDLTKMARRVCKFLLDSKSHPPDLQHAYACINEAQSFLYDDKLDEDEIRRGIDSALSRRDWTIASATIRLAIACLHRDWVKASELVPIAKADGLGYLEVCSWNIFREAWQESNFVESVMHTFALSEEDLRLPSPSGSLFEQLTKIDEGEGEAQ